MIGPKTYGVLRNLLAPGRPQEYRYRDVLTRNFEPQHIVIAERFNFYRQSQGEIESVDDFVAELRRLASSCEFGDFLDDTLRDRWCVGYQTRPLNGGY